VIKRAAAGQKVQAGSFGGGAAGITEASMATRRWSGSRVWLVIGSASVTFALAVGELGARPKSTSARADDKRRRRAAELALVVRRRGRSAAFRAARMTGAAVAAFLVAQLVGLHTPPPLIAALTALLVVQATLTSTLLNGLQRVASVVSGVGLAVLFAAVVGLSWWSLAALVAASIVVGQLLRLGPHLVEVPISAMLVLGVGASGAESVGGGRVVETLIGAAVGMLVNVVFPPAVQSRYAARSIHDFAAEIAGLLLSAPALFPLAPSGPPASSAPVAKAPSSSLSRLSTSMKPVTGSTK